MKSLHGYVGERNKQVAFGMSWGDKMKIAGSKHSLAILLHATMARMASCCMSLGGVNETRKRRGPSLNKWQVMVAQARAPSCLARSKSIRPTLGPSVSFS